MKIKLLLLENGKELPLWMRCPDCEGKSAWAAMSCERCGNTGIVPRYWTPERLIEAGYSMLPHDQIWFAGFECVIPFVAVVKEFGEDATSACVVFVVGQDCPSADWSDKEQQEYLESIGEE